MVKVNVPTNIYGKLKYISITLPNLSVKYISNYEFLMMNDEV